MTRTRRKHKYYVPESRWLRVDRPELRIVDQKLWDAAQERLARSRALYLTRTPTSGRLNGRPKVEGGIESKYLLSGFLVCDECGGRMMVNKRTGKRGRPVAYYVCSTHRTRAGACSVKDGLRATEAHERVIDLFLKKVLTPDNLKKAVDSLVRGGSQVEVLAAQRAPLAADLARIDRELVNLTAAIAATGQRPDVVLAAIAERETAKKKLVGELANLDRQEKMAREYDAGAEEKRLRAELKTWRDVLERKPDQGRAVLREILRGPIRARYFPVEGTWSLFGLASFGGIIHRLYSLMVPDQAAEALEAFARQQGFRRMEDADGYHRYIADGSGDGSAEDPGTSTLQSPMCPRQGSNTGPLAFRGRVFKLGAYLSLPA